MTSNGLSPEVLEHIFERGAAHAPAIERPDGGREMVVPEGYTTHTIPPLEPKLPRIRQTVAFYDLASFSEYVNVFKSDASRIFAVPGHMAVDGQAKVTAVLDYHTAAAADYRAHVAHYRPEYSEAWKRWVKTAGARPMQQAEFGEFIEENRVDIRAPEAAELLDMVNKFRATKKTDFNCVTNQANGDIVIGYTEETQVQGSRAGLQVPAQLVIGIPVFFKGEPYEVRMLMRYRLDTGKVTFTVKPDRPEYIEQDAFDGILALVAEATGIKPYLGVLA